MSSPREARRVGPSTRKVKAITEELCGHAFSASSISAINKRLDDSLAAFAERPLLEPFPDAGWCCGRSLRDWSTFVAARGSFSAVDQACIARGPRGMRADLLLPLTNARARICKLAESLTKSLRRLIGRQLAPKLLSLVYPYSHGNLRKVRATKGG